MHRSLGGVHERRNVCVSVKGDGRCGTQWSDPMGGVREDWLV